MIRSMTGYGRDQQTIGGLDITVEIRSVNHRYFEYASRLPRVYGFLDEKLKSFLQTGISRGKVDVSVWIETADTPVSGVSVNHPLAEAYLAAFRELCERYDLKDDVTVTALARQADVLSVHTVPADEDAVWEAVRQVAQAALEKFLRMRETEGEKLRADVLSRADAILRAVDPAQLVDVAAQPHRPAARDDGAAGTGRAQARFPRAGDQPGGEHHRLEIAGRGARPHGGGHEIGDREDPGTDSEYRVKPGGRV